VISRLPMPRHRIKTGFGSSPIHRKPHAPETQSPDPKGFSIRACAVSPARYPIFPKADRLFVVRNRKGAFRENRHANASIPGLKHGARVPDVRLPYLRASLPTAFRDDRHREQKSTSRAWRSVAKPESDQTPPMRLPGSPVPWYRTRRLPGRDEIPPPRSTPRQRKQRMRRGFSGKGCVSARGRCEKNPYGPESRKTPMIWNEAVTR